MIGMDLCLALMPIILIRTLSRPPREKILIGCLMATGLLATAFACYKTTTFQTKTEKDQLISSVSATFYAKLEQVLGIIAACMPSLKIPAEELLRRIGIMGEQHFPGMTRPSFVLSSRMEPEGGERRTEDQVGRMGMGMGMGLPLQDKGGLLHILGEGRDLGLGLGLVRTRSTEWTKGTGTTGLLTTVKSTSTKSTKSPRSDLTPSPLSDMEPMEQV
jgi:Fungal rhodopsin domain